MQAILGLQADALPVLRVAHFLFGPKTPEADNSYVVLWIILRRMSCCCAALGPLAGPWLGPEATPSRGCGLCASRAGD
jgi:hypothetical protein